MRENEGTPAWMSEYMLEYDWRSDFKASRARSVRRLKRHLEKRVKRYFEKGECDEPVKGRLQHFTKQYEKMHWVAAKNPQDYVDRLTNNFPVLVLEARRGLHVPRKAPLARIEVQQPLAPHPLPTPSNPCHLLLPTPPSPACVDSHHAHLQAKLGQVAGMRTRQSGHLAPCCNPGHALPVTDPRVSEGPCHLLSNLQIRSG